MTEPRPNVFLPDLCTTRAVLVVVVVIELMAIVITLVAGYFEPFSLERLALTSLFIQWIGLTSAALLCRLRDRLNGLPAARAALAVVGLVVLDTLVFSLLARWLLAWAADSMNEPLWHWDILANVLIAAIIGGLMMRYFYVQEQLHNKDRAELRARIQALQSRIRPHFLFNSMNIIATLVRIDAAAAEQAVEDLSRLFRASLRESGEQVSLAEELALCERYVRIEQLRLGDRLRMEWQVELDPETVRLPLLTLQPLVENAIYHGIQPRAEGGVVTLGAAMEQGRAVLRVRNPMPERAGDHQGNRMALDNIRHRLEALLGPTVRVEARESEQYYEVRILYPVQG
ncbi:sensor histidine kinase [Alloalcanivorax gelatiniphagus]|uniref:Sensor histidine kinase n=1 Tax=Alloalcanivorax gelatiniphagus TaxID=1194167 RepID=A0ABY2XIF7_9GAMM|nr:histidine kinase [Alloalcanivorax gelatiniphagus]TMW11622.1 sensor histidine kinase [Alloalcanivorax gelatiniphagus]|tara:strand:- start:13374 stop:14402 length:1029 start_codon:yes stop_codon:yes gene_type:complete